MIQPLQAFVDDSTESGVVLILAGYIANVQQWSDFSSEWQELLLRKPTRRIFKMRDVNLNNPTERQKAELHYRIIEKHIPFGFCIAMPIQPYQKICTELSVRKRYHRPFYMAWVLMLSVFRTFYTKAGLKQDLDVILDEHIGATDVNAAWDILLQKQKGDVAPLKNRPIFRRDEDFLPIQAADMLAWWARKNWVEYGSFGNQKRLFPWVEQASGPEYIFSEITEDGLRKDILANLCP